MPEPKHPTPKPVLRQVLGWVLVLPLMLSFVRLPFLLGPVVAAASIVASGYGVWFARHHASRRVTALALALTLFNIVSLLVLGTASLLKALYIVFRLYGYPPIYNWVYWNYL